MTIEKGAQADVVIRLAAVGAVVVFLSLALPLVAGAAPNDAAGHTVVAQQDSPYQAPDVEGVDAPAWLAPFGPLAGLPVWAQASVLSALAASGFLVLSAAARWVWHLGSWARSGKGFGG